MSIAKPFLNESIFQADISAKRVSGLMNFYKKERDINDPNPFSEILPIEYVNKILKDSNYWISQDLEETIINYLSNIEDISSVIYQIGNETFLSQSYDVLPGDSSQLTIHEFIIRIPILLSRLTRIIRLEVVSLEIQSATFSFRYEDNSREKWYDVIFFKGMLDGLSMLYELGDFKSYLKSTKLYGIHYHHKDLGDRIQFGADKNIYEIQWESAGSKVGKMNLNKSSIQKHQKTFVISKESPDSKDEYSVLNLTSIIHKSRELALENRDLEAAVEVLKSFKSELEIKQKSIAKDLILAKNIQQGLIPQSIPDWNGIQFWFYFKPMQEVSGDYFDYFPFSDGKLGIAVCDVSGHGVPAAFITALSKMLFSNYKNYIPSNIFKKVNRELLELLQYQGYTTCVYFVIDSNYNLIYSVAGHPRPIYYEATLATARYLEGEGTFLGMFPEANDYYEDNRIQMKPGDKIFLYTDGITEALNEEGEPYGEDRLINIIEKSANNSIRDSIELVIQDFKKFTMGTDQGDDITVLGWGLSPDIHEYELQLANGIKAYKNKEYNLATECFLLAKEIMPRELNNSLYLSKSLAKQGRFHQAIPYLLEYNQFMVKDYESHFILGYCYFMENQLDKSETELCKAMYIDDSHPSVYYNLLRVYAKLSQWDKYKKYLQKFKRNFPKNNRLDELENILKKVGV